MPEGTVRVSGLNLRRSVNPGKVIESLRKGRRVTILDTETWHRVRTRDGVEGFVFGDFIELDHDPGAMVTGSTEAPRPTLRRTTYHHDRFEGKPAIVDADFVPHLDRIAGFAKACKLKVHVTSSLRDPEGAVRNAIVTPAKGSNHFVGHAIDMNLRADDGTFYNSRKLKKLSAQPKAVRDFIGMVRDDPELRWGGDFTTPDVVHIDDGLNVRSPEVWQSKFDSRRTT